MICKLMFKKTTPSQIYWIYREAEVKIQLVFILKNRKNRYPANKEVSSVDQDTICEIMDKILNAYDNTVIVFFILSA